MMKNTLNIGLKLRYLRTISKDFKFHRGCVRTLRTLYGYAPARYIHSLRCQK